MQRTEGFLKTYLAVTVGAPKKPCDVIDAPMGYAEGSRYKMAVTQSGMPAVTAYETVSVCGGLALVRCRLHTGRTHQIRVHMAHLGCPLLGDWLYGTEDARIGRPALHAEKLRLVHPLTGETLTLFAPLPADMAKLFPAYQSVQADGAAPAD